MEKKKLTESERIAKVFLRKLQKMQREVCFDKHLSISIVQNIFRATLICVCVGYAEDKGDRKSRSYNEYFSFNPYSYTEENDAEFERLVAYVNEKSDK